LYGEGRGAASFVSFNAKELQLEIERRDAKAQRKRRGGLMAGSSAPSRSYSGDRAGVRGRARSCVIRKKDM
jgi:hypothetical protein